MHPAALAYVAAHVPRTVTSVLEFGSRNINGSPRSIVPPDCWYVGVDIEKGFGVDIVADAATVDVGGSLLLSHPKYSAEWVWLWQLVDPETAGHINFDAVICAEVFEHTDDQHCADIIANAFAHLYSGGMFVGTMAGPGRAAHSAADGGPLRDGEFYRNVGRDLLGSWLEAAGFDDYQIDIQADDIRCWARRP